MDSKSYFDAIAHQWDDMRRSFFSESLRTQAIATARVRLGTRAADIGAGTGFITEGLVQAGVHVIAVDQSEAMLNQMRKKLGDTVEYRAGEAHRLPIDDGEVEYVFAM